MKYVVLFKNGKTLTFSVQAAAELYVQAYGATLLNNPTEQRVIDLTLIPN